jgi:hypothetical protein
LATLTPETARAISDAQVNHARIDFTMPSTHKKVIVRKMGRDSLGGYVSPASFLLDGKLELLNQAGKVVLIELNEIKSVDFVRDLDDATAVGRKTFPSRPRTEGLWVRLNFKDNDMMEGVLPNDLVQLSPEGYLITPPDTRSNIQRIFVPRTALETLTVLAVIGRPEPRKKTAEDARQERLFGEQ